MEKVLTVVIPTYNMERYLERCLSSLVISPGLMEELEVLVINDGSKDCSSEIGHSFEAQYPNTFRVIDKKNGNYGSCINRGLKEARGKYIKILDADDWFETKNFEEFVGLLTTIDVDCVMTDMVQVDEQGNESIHWRYSLPPNQVSSLKDITSLSQQELIWMHCVAYRTENIRAINYHQTEGISYTDQEWIFLPMAICKRIYYYPSIIYKYLVGRNGQTMDPATYKKNFGQEIRGTINMVHKYYSIDKNQKESLAYLEKRLLIRSIVCYGTFLDKFKMEYFYDEIKELDDTLRRETSDLYTELCNFPKIITYRKRGFHNLFFPISWFLLIWLWRKQGKPKKLKLANLIWKFKSFVK